MIRRLSGPVLRSIALGTDRVVAVWRAVGDELTCLATVNLGHGPDRGPGGRARGPQRPTDSFPRALP